MNSIEEGEMKRRLTLLEPLGDEEEEDEMSQGEEAEGQNGEQSQVSGDFFIKLWTSVRAKAVLVEDVCSSCYQPISGWLFDSMRH